jgi:cytochrome oxidase Cu insertion factor (SCO1/SenC/PrrC family)
MQSNNSEAIKKSNRQNLLLLLAVFALPVVVATLMYVTGWKPSSTANHGELIQPARFIEEVSMQSIDTKPVKFSELRGKWTMVYFDTSECPEECVKQLYNMRQTHISQGKEQDRIQRIFILTDARAVESLKTKLADYPGMLVWTAERSALNKLTQDFGIEATKTSGQGYIYLLDPMGNLMMRYLPGIDPAGMRKDLVRLLKYSSEKQ